MATETILLELGGMHCEDCAANIRMCLRNTEGVVEATVDYPAATATVTYDPALVDVEALIGAVEDEGFTAKARGPAKSEG